MRAWRQGSEPGARRKEDGRARTVCDRGRVGERARGRVWEDRSGWWEDGGLRTMAGAWTGSAGVGVEGPSSLWSQGYRSGGEALSGDRGRVDSWLLTAVMWGRGDQVRWKGWTWGRGLGTACG